MFLSHVPTHVRLVLGVICAIRTIELALLNQKIAVDSGLLIHLQVFHHRRWNTIWNRCEKDVLLEIVASSQFKFKEISNTIRNSQSDHFKRKYTIHISQESPKRHQILRLQFNPELQMLLKYSVLLNKIKLLYSISNKYNFLQK